MNVFSDRLKQLKDDSGLLLKDISEKTNITVPNLSYYMKGREPNYETLCTLADFFNVTTDYLVGHSNQKRHESEAIAKTIQSQTILTTNNELRTPQIEQYSVELHDLLTKLSNLETEDDNFENVWKMVDTWLEGFSYYYAFSESYQHGNYPLDDAMKSMDIISKSRAIAIQRIGKMLEEILDSDSVDKEIKSRVIRKSTFGIRSVEEIEKEQDKNE